MQKGHEKARACSANIQNKTNLHAQVVTSLLYV